MANKLFETADRDECHRMLEGFLCLENHPNAECREYFDGGLPYSIWDGPQDPNQRDPEEDKRIQKLQADMIAEQVSQQVAKIMEAIMVKIADAAIANSKKGEETG